MTKNTNRVRNITAKHSVRGYSVEIVADISGRSATGMIPENVEIYQNGQLIFTDRFKLIGYTRAEIVAIVNADAAKIANRLDEFHTYVDSFGSTVFFIPVS